MVVPSAMVLEGGDDVQVEGEGGGGGKSISCSICLEAIADADGRSWAKLQCGHEFHLDCIGSAFNVKGAMQCPNCRKIEKGQWLYANGCRSIPEFSMDDWTHDEDLYDLSYTDVAFHWCPFGQLPRVPPTFEDGDFPAAAMAYHDVQHAIFAEHSAIPPPATHPCPYVAYLGPMHPSGSSSSSSVSMTDGTNFPSHHWNGGPPPSEVPSSFSFSPGMDHFFRHGWEPHQSPPFSTSNTRADQQPSVVQRSTRTGADGSRSGSGSFMHPFFVGPLSPGALSGTSLAPIPTSLYQGSNARSRDRVQALQAYYQQQQQPTNLPPPPTMHAAPMMSTTRRSNGHRGSTSSAEQSNGGGGFFFVPTSSSENPVSGRFHSWEREPSPSSFTLNVGGGQVERDSGWGSILHPSPEHQSGQMMPGGFRPRPHDRAPSQHR